MDVTVSYSARIPAPSPKARRRRSDPPALVCFSHLRWDFVFQRPQQLMTRFARGRRVIFVEEPEPGSGPRSTVSVREDREHGVTVLRPQLVNVTPDEALAVAASLLRPALLALAGADPILWFYTPMMLPLAEGLRASAVVYDCMDDLSGFRFAPPDLRDAERRLMALSDVVFTGGWSLYEAKQALHANVQPFPSSVDVAHFATARRTAGPTPSDQAGLPRPRFGYYGVIDERIDGALLDHVANRHPEWSIVLVGPVVKIDATELPKAENVHFLGAKSYMELPAYLAGWDVALMPFADNDSTRFISPTKTPEYLAGGRPVVSTPVRDVVRHYGHLEAVRIAFDEDGFVAGCEEALALARRPSAWLPEVDAVLAGSSWDRTAEAMLAEIDLAVQNRTGGRMQTAP